MSFIIPIQYFFDQTNTTFRFANGEFKESAHSSVKTFESTHGCQTVKNLGTPIHMQRSLRGHTQFNSTHAGSSIPTRKATQSPKSSSRHESCSPSTRIFSTKFKEQYPEAVQEHINRFTKKYKYKRTETKLFYSIILVAQLLSLA